MPRYIRKTYGPGDIAALPPTIGLTSRAPTIGAEDVGKPIKPAFGAKPHHPKRGSRGWPVEQAALYGLGTEGGSQHPWLMPVGAGLAIGIGIAYWMRKRAAEEAF